MAIEFIHSLEVAGDLTVDGVISKSDGGSSTQWDAAYGWGNHADAGYSTSNTNYYLNGVSFDTGNGKITFTISGATNKTVDIDGRYVISSHQGGGDYFAGHHSEGRLLANAYLSNDLGNARKRGSEFTLTNTSLSDGEIDSMFDGLATMAGIPTSDFEAGPVVIEFDIPRTLSYGAYVGIGFGNSTWRCKDVKIEAYSNGAWVTCVHETNNAYEDVYTNIPGNSGVGTTKFRYTLDKPNNNVRICHLWAYNYNSHLWSQIMMPRSGGQVYGDLTLDGKITASGSNSTNWDTAYNWGDHAEGGYLASNAKAADSEKLDGIDSTGFVKQVSDGSTPDYQTPSSRRINPTTKNPTNAHYAISTFGNGGNVTGQLATHFQTGDLHSRGYNSVWSDWRRYHHSLDFSVTDVANGVTAHGWGDHKDLYLGITSKAADSDKLDGIDSSRVIYGDNATGTDSITGAQLNPEGHLKSGFYRVAKADSTIPNATSVNFVLHTSYSTVGNTAGFDLASNDKQDSDLYFRSATGGGRGDWQTIYTSRNFTDSSSNWNEAYGWGNHADGGYLTSLPTHGHETIQAESTYSIDVKDHGGHTWFRNASNQWTFQAGSSGDDWTQTFTHYLPNRTTANALMMEIGQRSSNAVDGSYKGVRIVKYASSKVVDGHLQVGTISITDGSSDNWNTAYGWGNHANAGYKTTDNDTIFNGGTVTNAIIAPRLGLTNNAEDTTENRITVYDSGTTSYGMMLWNANGTSSDWATMIYGPNQSNRRISFGKANADFAKGHSGVDELAWLDLDNGNYFTDGNIYPGGSTTKYVSTGRIDNWNTAHGWGNHADAGYITSIPINSKYVRSDVDDEATGKINFAYQVADFNDINGGLGVTPFKGAFQAKNRPGSGNYATGLEFTYHDSKARTQFAAASSGNNNTGELYVRSEKWGEDKVWSDWWKILHTGNSNTSNWDTAHGWGNHADGGYLTSYSETSDLESVRARDNKIAGVINFTPDTGDILQVDGQVILKRTTANGGITIGHDDSVIIAGGDTSSTLNTNINNAEETVFIGAEGGLKVFAFPDNMSGGWGARKEWRFQNDGDTDFPGKLYPSGGSTHYVDSTRIANWQTAYGWGDHSTRGYLTRSKPESPKILSRIVGDTIEVVITASGTGNIDQYLVFSSVVGSDFGLISVIPPDDFAEEMSVIDNSFDEGGKIEYRVYAVKQGVYSDVATTSQDFSVGELEPTNLSVVDLNNAKYIQWDAPSSKKRFVSVYNVYHHEHDTQGSLLRSSASLIYSGTNTSYMKPTSNNKFHQFWVEITES